MDTGVTKMNEIVSSENLIQQLQSQHECRRLPQKGELSCKQRALLTKYANPESFMRDYNPDLQGKLLRIGATHAGLAMNQNIPSLGLLASTYGDETPVEWLVIQFGSLNDFAEVKSKINNDQIYELANLVLSEYYYLNAAEILLFIGRFKMGYYGTFYGAIDPMKITNALMQYVRNRRIDIERYEREQYRIQRQKEIEERGNNRISYVEYLKLKKRAESGDSEAIKILRNE